MYTIDYLDLFVSSSNHYHFQTTLTILSWHTVKLNTTNTEIGLTLVIDGQILSLSLLQNINKTNELTSILMFCSAVHLELFSLLRLLLVISTSNFVSSLSLFLSPAPSPPSLSLFLSSRPPPPPLSLSLSLGSLSLLAGLGSAPEPILSTALPCILLNLWPRLSIYHNVQRCVTSSDLLKTSDFTVFKRQKSVWQNLTDFGTSIDPPQGNESSGIECSGPSNVLSACRWMNRTSCADSLLICLRWRWRDWPINCVESNGATPKCWGQRLRSAQIFLVSIV